MKSFDLLLDECQANDVEIWKSQPASDNAIEIVENKLDLKFSPQYRKFLSKYGSLGIGVDQYFNGIIDNNPLKPCSGNVLQDIVNLQELSKCLPKGIIPIEEHEDGAFCLDTRKMGVNGEFPIVNFDALDGWKPVHISSCLLEYLITRIIAFELDRPDLNFREYDFI